MILSNNDSRETGTGIVRSSPYINLSACLVDSSKKLRKIPIWGLWFLLLALNSCVSSEALQTSRFDAPVETGEMSVFFIQAALEGQAGEIEAPDDQKSGAGVILASILESLKQGNYERALSLFDTIDPQEAAAVQIRLLKASVLSSAGRNVEARNIINEVIAAEPSNLEALFVLSTLEGVEGREKEQQAILERIVKADPKNTRALVELGTIHMRNRRARPAASSFDDALKVEPENLDALIGRAALYRVARDPKNAEALLNKAVTLHPNQSAPWSERARLYRSTGYPQEALADLNKAKELNSQDYWIAVDRGNVLLDLNQKADALVEFELAKKLDPENFLAWVFSAGIKDELKDYEGAEEDYRVTARLRPDYYFAQEGLGVYKMRKGQWAPARDAFMEAYKQAPQEHSYALLAAINWIRAGQAQDPKQFLDVTLKKVKRDTLEWYMVRLYLDLSNRVYTGETDVASRLEQEKDNFLKARMAFYMAHYYDIRGNRNLADKYFLLVRELNYKNIPEWRLNEWTLESRNLARF